MMFYARKPRKRSKSPQPGKTKDPSKPQKPTGPRIRKDTRKLYPAFLSARHIHFAAAFCIFLASSLALITLSAVFVTITTTKASVLQLPLVRQLVVWFCVFRRKLWLFKLPLPKKCAFIWSIDVHPFPVAPPKVEKIQNRRGYRRRILGCSRKSNFRSEKNFESVYRPSFNRS
jgi:hypothetical protein